MAEQRMEIQISDKDKLSTRGAGVEGWGAASCTNFYTQGGGEEERKREGD
jgi:hypothetical protein